MLILGIADKENLPSYALLKNGDIIHCDDYIPEGLPIDQIDSIAYFQKPFLRLERALETHIAHIPKSFLQFKRDIPSLFKNTFSKKRDIIRSLMPYAQNSNEKDIAQKLLFSDEAFSLCADVFFPSPHEEAVILCLGTMGEWSSTSVALGCGSTLKIEKEILYPHSLGYFLDAFAHYSGLSRQAFIALAEQGEPNYARILSREVMDIKDDGSFLINQFYFGYAHGDDYTNHALHELLGGLPRNESEAITQKHRDIAASVLMLVKQMILLMVQSIAREYRGIHNLCIVGDIVREPKIYKHILSNSPFGRVDISQNQGNPALARGAALAAYYTHHNSPRDIMFLQNLPTAAQK